MNVKVLVRDLKPGMFVTELDRPWLDTPFLLQGFLLESPEDLEEIRKLCQFVYVDPERSTARVLGLLAIPSKNRDDEKAVKPKVRLSTVITYAEQQHGARGSPGGVKGGAAGGNRPDDRVGRSSSTSDPGNPPEVEIHSGSQAKGSANDRGGKERIWEVAASASPEPRPIVRSDQAGPKRSGFLKNLLNALRSKSDHEPEKERPADAEEVQLAYAKPLIRVDGNRIVHDEELVQAKEIHHRSQDLVREIVDDIRRERQLDLEKANEVIEEMVASVSRNPDALLWLTKLKSRDTYAYDHGIDVAIQLLAFARHLGFPNDTLHGLGLSGLMQDIGKLKLRQELLNKPGKLTAAEFQEVQSHVRHSLDILKMTKNIPSEVLSTVAQHHERTDGSGYPGKLSGDQIHTYGAMAAIVDSFAALTSERPYASALSTHQALQQLNRWKGSVFHDGLTEQFVQCIGIFPVGSLIELSSGDVAVVIAQNKIRRLKPRIMLLLDPQKRPYKYPIMLDLINDPLNADNTPYQIKRDLPVGAYNIDPTEYYL